VTPEKALNVLDHTDNPRYRALIATDTNPQCHELAREMITPEATWSPSRMAATFPSGAQVLFRAITGLEDAHCVAGCEFQYMDCTRVSDRQAIRYLQTRCREGGTFVA
jgi:hypothetical protein